MIVLIGLLLTLLPFTHADFVIEPEFQSVTCGSSIKLAHTSSGFRLHSHGINYGSGSGQQSVTGFSSGDDANSYFLVMGPLGETCKRGVPIKCGESVRLFHMSTNKYLHSHAHAAPLSGNQEVSAYEYTDSGDNWVVQCQNKKDKLWHREAKIRLQHKETSKYLSSNTKYQFRNPIPGQLEICAVSSAGNNELWQVQEGIFFEDATHL